MLKVGITGGIGSGKSTACKMFEELGIPVYDADSRAKYLMQHEHYLIDQIKKHFGEEVYENGRLNRQFLAAKVFENKELLAKLNSLVHPAVFKDNLDWTAEQATKKVPYVLKEAALLIESGSYRKLDKLIVVTAPEKIRFQRVTDRDGLKLEEVLARAQHQLPEEEKIKLADFVIVNDGDLDHLRQQVENIHRVLSHPS